MNWSAEERGSGSGLKSRQGLGTGCTTLLFQRLRSVSSGQAASLINVRSITLRATLRTEAASAVVELDCRACCSGGSVAAHAGGGCEANSAVVSATIVWYASIMASRCEGVGSSAACTSING